MKLVILSGLFGALALGAASPASALSMKECSAKYQAAKGAGATAKWNDFRKTECSADTTAAGAALPTAAATEVKTPAARAASSPAGSITYPTAIDPKYAKEKPGKARLHTCLDAYNAAKAAGTLGETKWISKGAGFYSTCNARLKS